MSNEDIINELKNISKVLILSNSDKITTELEKTATNNERKIIWVLINGINDNKGIAERVGITERSVRRTIKLFEEAELVDNPWGKPARRLLNYVPPAWIELLPPEKEVNEEGEKSEDE